MLIIPHDLKQVAAILNNITVKWAVNSYRVGRMKAGWERMKAGWYRPAWVSFFTSGPFVAATYMFVGWHTEIKVHRQ